MSPASRLFWLVLPSLGIIAAQTAQAENQLYLVPEVSWSVKAFGNECEDRYDPTPGPYCGDGASESQVYSAVGLPQGIQCNPNFPRCPFSSTPTDGSGNFFPLAGWGHYCAPWYNWGGKGTAVRPDKGMTPTTGGSLKRRTPPLYRNPVFFTSGGAPRTTICTAASTGVTPGGKGRLQAGNPVTGFLLVDGTGGANGGFAFPAAGSSTGPGIRASGVAGEFFGTYGDPAGYTYTYATLRNNAGVFGPGDGPGSFSIVEKQGGTVARMRVKEGAAKFGGTMTMLGALTTKVCYALFGGCSMGTHDWRYDAIGTAAPTVSGVVTNGHVVAFKAYYYHTALMVTSTVEVEGSRFPWTTGSVTVTATGRGSHNTVHYARGYDNRETTRTGYPYARQMGTLQLVTPVLTRWLRPGVNFETAGIGILRFAPEPRSWWMLTAGAALLVVGYRLRKPSSAARDGRQAKTKMAA